MTPETARRRRRQAADALLIADEFTRLISVNRMRYWPELQTILDEFVNEVSRVAEARLRETNQDPTPCCANCRCHVTPTADGGDDA